MDKLRPSRKTIHLPPRSYLGTQFYFATLCCHRRRRVFRNPSVCFWVLELLASEADCRRFSILAYCLMSDHLHFLALGLDSTADFAQFVKSFKIKSSRKYHRNFGEKLWQRRYFDHVVRNGESVESVAWYIWLNPVRRGLVATPQEYRYSGSFSGMNMPVTWSKPDWRPEWGGDPRT